MSFTGARAVRLHETWISKVQLTVFVIFSVQTHLSQTILIALIIAIQWEVDVFLAQTQNEK